MKITITENLRNLKKGDIYDFNILSGIKSICIVGENGCGKSTLFQALRGYKNDLVSNSMYEDNFIKMSNNINVEHSYEKIFYLDSVKDNGSDFKVSYDASTYLESGGFQTKDKSHGQSSLIYLNMFIDKIKNRIVKNKTLKHLLFHKH